MKIKNFFVLKNVAYHFVGIVSLLLTSFVNAQTKCNSVFNSNIKSNYNSTSTSNSISISNFETLTLSDYHYLKDLKIKSDHPFFNLITEELKKAAVDENNILNNLKTNKLNPNLGAQNLKNPKANSRLQYKEKLFKFITALDLAYKGDVRELAQNIENESEATLIFSLLTKHKDHEKMFWIFSELKTRNPFFKNDVYYTPNGAPITYSFEKETRNTEALSHFYKIKDYSFVNWLKLPEEERKKQLLYSLNYNKKNIESLETKPKYLQSLDKDGLDVYEVRKNNFGLSFEKTIQELIALSQNLQSKATTSQQKNQDKSGFHFHISFEINYDYEYAKNFHIWAKHLNDYLALKGIEEGRHPNELTSLFKFETSEINDFMMEKFNWLFKFHSAGLRSNIYGSSILDPIENSRIGIELRDVSKSTSGVKEIATQVLSSVRQFIWEKNQARDNETDKSNMIPTKISTYTSTQKNLILRGVNNHQLVDLCLELFEHNNTFLIPLINFESLKYFNYKTAQFETPDLVKKQKIVQARDKYLNDIHNELENFSRHMDEVPLIEQELYLETILKMALNQWGREAQVSELYSNY